MEQLNNIKTVGALVRISDLKKGSGGKRVDFEETLKNHIQRIQEFCEPYGWEIKWFKEVQSGGKQSLDDRKELKDLLDNIEHLDAIVCIDLNRLSRQGEISQIIKSRVMSYRKLIITVTPFTIYDIATKAMDGMFYDFTAGIGEYERRIIAGRVKQNKLDIAKNGLNASGKVPLGYVRTTDKKLVIDEEKAKIVRMAFKLCLDGFGAKKIAEELNTFGFKTAKDNAFSSRAIKEMLKLETYKGTMIYNDYERTGNQREIKDSIVIENAHPAIIDAATFDQVQKVKYKRAEMYGQVNREKESVAPSIIKDLLVCSDCGRKTRISYESKRGHLIRKCTDLKQDGSRCSNHGFVAANVESMVIQEVFKYQKQLEENLLNLKSNNLESRNEELKEQQHELENRMATLKFEMRAIMNQEKEFNKLKELGQHDDFEGEIIADDKMANKHARDKVQQKLNDINDKLNSAPSIHEEIQVVTQNINIINEIKKQDEPHKINAFLKRIINKITYERILPADILELGTKNPLRKNYPATIKIEFM